MKIVQNAVVTFHYTLTEKDGGELESNRDAIPIAYLHGHNNLLPGLEAALVDKEAGDELTVELPPEKAYGYRKDNAVQRVPVKHLAVKPKRLIPGMFVKVQTEKGAIDGQVVKAGKFMVDVDMNHPFAGKTLIFNIKVDTVREATEEEIAHRHAHGTGGHHH